MKKAVLSLGMAISTLFQAGVAQAEELKFASWNIAWLGSHEYNERKASDYQQLAHYAKKLNADVIALQEVEDASWARKVFGDDYDYYFSTKDWVQRVGVAVKKSSGYAVKAQEYKALDVGRVRNGMDVTLSKGDKKIQLLAVHLKSGCFDSPLDQASVSAMPSTSKKEAKRKEACEKLSKQISPLENWIDQRASEQVPFIVLGDFNRRFSRDIALNYPENQGLWQALDDEGAEDLWTPTATADSACWGGYYKDYIDHIIFNPEAKKHYVKGSFDQLVFDEKYSRELSQTLSDHCPVSVKINL
ncbi:endonuclease/exonuclease/phosphatase family protein [Thalassomonas sp. RHCl1]|uniref:endonuclease/exonuclease/phosphatase family protein n=1 Tax=Thalassomonas sp. RHCl1 TaxID=2995320 RepID=UPI00248D14B1|nr:endonuclease/exonuclease/phosphatase family protein [Thalassomonas sp. RHCl1]